jgi:1,2-diacylglycerol 3-alpha-glucosyltransferase
MKKIKVGVVTAWAECGMGYLAKNWIHTLDKHPDKIDYQIFSRSNKHLSKFRWLDKNVTQGPDEMDINHPSFWRWVDEFKPDVLWFQDQNIYSKTDMQEETQKLRARSIKLINYADWIKNSVLKKYRGLYDINLAHVKRNYRWLQEAQVETPTYIPWGVILNHFPFQQRSVKDKVRFYINLGTGTLRKGYQYVPTALSKMEGGWLRKKIAPKKLPYEFIATSIAGSEANVKKSFQKYFAKHPQCHLTFNTADNSNGGLFPLGDIYVYPTRKEGVGLTITEAMCSGMPVITTNHETMNEWFKDNEAGRLIKPRRIRKSSTMEHTCYPCTRDLANLMLDYIEHPEKVAEHSANARRRIESDFNWDDRDQKILQLLEV